jgi:hypothetical protein
LLQPAVYASPCQGHHEVHLHSKHAPHTAVTTAVCCIITLNRLRGDPGVQAPALPY